MAIEAVQKEVKNKTTKHTDPPPVSVSEPAAPSVGDVQNNIALDMAERRLNSMYETPQPIISRMSFSLDVTIPTGNFENLRPKIEIEYIVPEGAIPPNEVEQMEILRAQIALFIYPLVDNQTKSINVKTMALQENEQKAKLEMAATYTASSPLFKWLTTFERNLAGKLLSTRIADYKDMS